MAALEIDETMVQSCVLEHLGKQRSSYRIIPFRSNG